MVFQFGKKALVIWTLIIVLGAIFVLFAGSQQVQAQSTEIEINIYSFDEAQEKKGVQDEIEVDNAVYGDNILIEIVLKNPTDYEVQEELLVKVMSNSNNESLELEPFETEAVPELNQVADRKVTLFPNSQTKRYAFWLETNEALRPDVGSYTIMVEYNHDREFKSLIVGEEKEMSPLWYIIPITALISLLAIFISLKFILDQDTGDNVLTKYSKKIISGSTNFQKMNLPILLGIGVILSLLVYLGYGIYSPNSWDGALLPAVSFFVGSLITLILTYLGIFITSRANAKMANASKKDYSLAFQIAIKSGSVIGFASIALSLIGLIGLFFGLGGDVDNRILPHLLLDFGAGASISALILNVMCAVYGRGTKTATGLGSQVIGGFSKVDVRNPGIFGEFVGQNISNGAGEAVRLFDLATAENIAVMILAVALYPIFGVNGILFPLIVRAFGLLASIVGILMLSPRDHDEATGAIKFNYILTCILSAAGFFIASYYLLGDNLSIYLNWWFYAGLLGIVASVLLVYVSNYYSSEENRPALNVAVGSKTGEGSHILSSFSMGLESTLIGGLILCGLLAFSFYFGQQGAEASDMSITSGGLFGVAMATMGLLSTSSFIFSINQVHNLSSNANKIIDLANYSKNYGKISSKIKRIGDFTRVLARNYSAFGSLLVGILLFSAFMILADIDLTQFSTIGLFIGGLVGTVLILLLTGFIIKSIGRTISAIIANMKEQCEIKPGLTKGREEPDYSAAISSPLKGMLKFIMPITIALAATPVVFAFLLDKETLGGILVVSVFVGSILAFAFSNMTASSKGSIRYIEKGHFEGKGGKTHQSSISGLKSLKILQNVVSPSINTLIRAMGTIALVLALLSI